MLVEFYQCHKLRIDIFFIVLIAVVGRVFYCGGKLREIVGDVIIGPLLVALLAERMPSISLAALGLDVSVSHYELAFIVGIVGVHGVKEAAFYILKTRFGIDVRARRFDKQQEKHGV
ncbi:hypothetical protein CHU32_03670 [Superficieibacter electus]|uniref:Holin n=2 Tax=Superficieibacter electus TaxID=2022662 RepID=A0A2P5GVI5_9ENTR|nr:hypothetical protein CHU33_19955 [Superficieibacter electus]POP50533.1 hypothetical protein CHU32_03670 [Superficieibacter electus]